MPSSGACPLVLWKALADAPGRSCGGRGCLSFEKLIGARPSSHCEYERLACASTRGVRCHQWGDSPFAHQTDLRRPMGRICPLAGPRDRSHHQELNPAFAGHLASNKRSRGATIAGLLTCGRPRAPGTQGPRAASAATNSDVLKFNDVLKLGPDDVRAMQALQSLYAVALRADQPTGGLPRDGGAPARNRRRSGEAARHVPQKYDQRAPLE